MYPQECPCTEEHEWIPVDEQGRKIGITDHPERTGGCCYVEPPRPGNQMTASESFGTVESVKAVSKRCSPVSGEVTGVTSKLRTSQEILNPDFHRDGQAVFVQIPDWKVGMNPLAADDCEVYL